MQFRFIARLIVVSLKHPAVTRFLTRIYRNLPPAHLTDVQRQHLSAYRAEYEATLSNLSGIKRQRFVAHHDRFALQQHIISALVMRRRYNDYRYL
jgi:hypothetical protein